MGLIQDIREAFHAIEDKRRQQTEKYRTEYAFTCGGTAYYRFADITNLPYERGLQALYIYNQIEMRCSRDFLLKYTEATDKILHGKDIDIYTLNQMNEILKQRLAMPTDVELLYQLASVAFFDATENPAVYEQAYAEKKIAKWRKDKEVAAFFSQKALKELMPFLANVGCDLNTFSKINEELNKVHGELLRTLTSIREQNSTKAGKTS
jgi:hypothetical protein